MRHRSLLVFAVPESILTAELIPYFESALSAEDEARASLESTNGTTEGKPLHMRRGSSLALRKAPSLSTLAMPSFAGKRSVSESLLNALTWLLARLPRENRDLLYTVIELIRATAARERETRMNLGNLLLVFCPSLNMNPTLLRVLCEHESIWAGLPQVVIEPEPTEEGAKRESQGSEVLDIRATFVTAPETSLEESSPSDAAQHEASVSSSEDQPTEDEEWNLHTPSDASSASADVATGDVSDSQQRMEIPTQESTELALLSPISPVSPISLKDDSGSFVSALEPPSSVPTRDTSPITYSPQVPPPLTSSSDSLSSPSEMSEEPNSPKGRLSHDHNVAEEGKPSASQNSLVIPESVDLSLPPTPRRPVVSPITPVPFPSSSGGNSPQTPVSRRKSFALLSFPPIRSDPGVPSTNTPPSTWHRPKRPSLHLLLSKISGSRNLSTPTAGSASAMASVPTLSLYTQSASATASVPTLAPQTTAPSFPPTLDTPISSSPIHLGFEDMANQIKGKSDTVRSAPASSTPSEPHDTQLVEHLRVRADSYVPSLYTTPVGMTPQQTPIADLYQNRSKSVMSFVTDADMPIHPMSTSHSAASQLSMTPSIDLPVEETHDWAQSVLMAAQAEDDTKHEGGRQSNSIR